MRIGAHNPEDPFEAFNRYNFNLNEGLDRTLLAPVARGYDAVAPKPLRQGISNFGRNLGEPVTLVNQLLQGQFDPAMQTLARFTANSTVGLLGIFDLSGALDLEHASEDFGQTLGAWGVPAGPYLVMPLLGSTNPRDLLGRPVDIAYDLNTYILAEADGAVVGSLRTLQGVNARANVIEQVDALREQPDPYTLLRRLSIQNREAAVQNAPPSRPPTETDVMELPEFDPTP
jgi:phospholipid-binding lipoprotein MlaA